MMLHSKGPGCSKYGQQGDVCREGEFSVLIHRHYTQEKVQSGAKVDGHGCCLAEYDPALISNVSDPRKTLILAKSKPPRVPRLSLVLFQSLVKSSWESRDRPTIIPQGVPYMVKLLRYYVSEDAVYLHLEHVRGELVASGCCRTLTHGGRLDRLPNSQVGGSSPRCTS